MGEIISASVAIDGSDKGEEAAVVENKKEDGSAVVVEQKKEGESGEEVVENKKEGEAGEGADPAHPADALKDKELPKPDKTEQQQDLEKATGLDLDPYSEEFQREGKLSEKSYKELEERGLKPATVNTIIKGLQAAAHEHLRDLAETVGGTDNYNAIMAWGKGALTDDEKFAAVKVLTAGGAEGKVFLQGLQARFKEANGSPPKKRSGGGGGPQADVFESRGEQAAAMRDPRYKSNAKYRDSVIAKSLRSFGAAGSKKRTKSNRRPKAKR